MKRAAFVCVTVLSALACGSAEAGSYQPPGGDSAPAWLADGSIAFTGLNTMVTNVDGSNPQVLSGQVWALHAAPSKPLVAFNTSDAGKQWLAVAAADGSPTRQLVENGVPVGWLADS